MSVGIPVWDPLERGKAERSKAADARIRREVLRRDNYACVICGIAGGEEYGDGSRQTAVLSVLASPGLAAPSDGASNFSTRCRRCVASIGFPTAARRDGAEGLIASLSPGDRATLRRWINQGCRDDVSLDRLWRTYVNGTDEIRHEIRSRLEGLR